MRREIGLGDLKAGFGGTLAGTKFRDAGGFLDQVAAVGRFCREDLADAALFDDRVMRTGKARARKQVLNVTKTAIAAV